MHSSKLPWADFRSKFNLYIEKLNGPLAEMNFTAVAGYEVSDYEKIIESTDTVLERIQPTIDYLHNEFKPMIVEGIDPKTKLKKRIVAVGSTSIVKEIYKTYKIPPTPFLIKS